LFLVVFVVCFFAVCGLLFVVCCFFKEQQAWN